MLQIPGSQNKLELAFETKLLGYWLTEDMKPKKHIKYILSIAYKRIWAVRRLKTSGVSRPLALLLFKNSISIRKFMSYFSTNADPGK